MNEINQLRSHLRSSISTLSSLKLYQAAKWSAEALNGMKIDDDEESDVDLIQDEETTPIPTIYQIRLNSKDHDQFELAKTYFDCKEFDRCYTILKNSTNSNCIFLKLYSLLISGDLKREQESEGALGSNDLNSSNKSIPIILKEIESLFNKDKSYKKNPFINYLYGITLLKQKSTSLAQDALITSLKQFPFNWSCWLELIHSISNIDEALNIFQNLESFFHQSFPNSTKFSELIMIKLGKLNCLQEFFQQTPELYNQLNELLEIFPIFSFIKIQKALISYHALEYTECELIFDDILTNDPLRLDDMDLYSNILYVMQKRSKLSYLAQLACSIDKFRPETCCIVANYYSLKFEHEKAIMYYRRALVLNRNCLSAWTLMGHEFVELKNTHAAIESYRRAVDTNQKDFKAWYGLGQAYEILDMHLYSLYYYQKACYLKPLDSRIWQALGNCYDKLSKFKDSIKCYKKSLFLNNNSEISKDVTILFRIAKIFENLNELSNCYEFMKQVLNEELENNQKNDLTSQARLWLAKYEQNLGNWENAYFYAMDMNSGTSQEIEEAKMIAREAKNKMNGITR
ncbi:Anaphase-promoting complex subunit 8 [Wickerhamomyces ciferrii]|uniref:Anaphase-promoting complex subunit 8 n=1 Tax=Wickerhamomyces ciferrii (strain ATCC 14091 / BCRC 22168 / CBS 111 / JCM 3599 / NBRC 0793 / NRRL Y-1031 F-60-10) TaxID=1206466 RepID=K0KHJ2_WICCF|nr:Anaphase-promoting complex subunit 8 [Wickerhamomyces ciferrii]CCH40638.1 Anaphase-promoting complex subunit 8 [Wickerhamomyces ciferrii]